MLQTRSLFSLTPLERKFEGGVIIATCEAPESDAGVIVSYRTRGKQGRSHTHKVMSDVARVDDSTLVLERSEFSLTSTPTCARNEASCRSP